VDLFFVRTPLEVEAVRVIVERGTDPVAARRRLDDPAVHLGRPHPPPALEA